MDKIQRYKKMYPAEKGEPNELVIEQSGKVHIPKWLLVLVLHTSGLKSRKKRQVKKILKREIKRLIMNHVEQQLG